VQPELPEGTTFAIKDEFWLYEIQRKAPYWGKIHHAITPSVKQGISISKYKYIKSIPAGTRFEVVSSRRDYASRQLIYFVKPVNYDDPEYGSVLIEMSRQSMLEELHRRSPFGLTQAYKYLRLDMSLFKDFTYPDKR